MKRLLTCEKKPGSARKAFARIFYVRFNVAECPLDRYSAPLRWRRTFWRKPKANLRDSSIFAIGPILCLVSLFSPTLFGRELPSLWIEAGSENQVVFAAGLSDQWTLRVDHRVLASGRAKLEPASSGDLHVATIKPPPQHPGVCLHGTLSFGTVPTHEVILASSDPFENRKTWFEEHPIALYDPEEKTAESLRQDEIPFQSLRSFAEIEHVEKRVIVIGQGTDFEREIGLAELLFDKTARGAAVLVAAPKGSIPLDYHPSICSLNLCSEAKYLFSLARKRSEGNDTGAHWMLEARGDRLFLVEKSIRPVGKDESAAAKGVGPTILDIRFTGPRHANQIDQSRGRIVFDKEFQISRWNDNIVIKYHFKALVETLNQKPDLKNKEKTDEKSDFM